MNLEQWFEKGMSAERYIESMEVNKEKLKTILNRFEVPQEDETFFTKIKEEQLRVIVLTEDWCGDAMLNVPILLKLAEKTDMNVRMLLRDQNLELMDQYLTNSTSRAIPIFIFIDRTGNERAVWGSRAEAIQQYVEEQRATLPPKDDPTFTEKQKELYENMHERYTSDESVWNEVYNSLKRRIDR